MNEPHIVAAAHAALHGAPQGQLRTAWRRAAAARQPATGSSGWSGASAALAALAALGGAALLLAAVFAAGPAGGAPAAPLDVATDTPALLRDAALQAFRAQRYAAAYGRFAQLADVGDPMSALIALTMVESGPALFGSEWSASPGQLRRWHVAAQAGAEARAACIAEHDRGE